MTGQGSLGGGRPPGSEVVSGISVHYSVVSLVSHLVSKRDKNYRRRRQSVLRSWQRPCTKRGRDPREVRGMAHFRRSGARAAVVAALLPVAQALGATTTQEAPGEAPAEAAQLQNPVKTDPSTVERGAKLY